MMSGTRFSGEAQRLSQSPWKIHNVMSEKKIKIKIAFRVPRRALDARDGLSFRSDVIAPRSPRKPLSPPPSVAPQVHIKVSVPKGIKFVGHPGKHHLTRKKCVPPGEATPTSIVFSVTELGPANITGGRPPPPLSRRRPP